MINKDIPKGYAFVFRNKVTCCVSDAVPIGLLIDKKKVEKFKNKDWLKLGGKFSLIKINNRHIGYLDISDIKSIKPPSEEKQYLY